MDRVNDEIQNDKDFEKSDKGIQTHGSIEEIQFPQKYQDGGKTSLDNINEEEKNFT